MKKRLISLIVAVVMLFSMLCPAAYADDETVSFDTCTHEWETPLRSGYSITIPGSDVSFSVKTEQCKKCKWYKHVATIFIAEFTYYSPLNVDANGLVPTELAAYWANVWYNNFGKNATATKFTPGGGSTSGGGVGRPKGYADDNGSAMVSPSGEIALNVPCVGIYGEYKSNSNSYVHNNEPGWVPNVTELSNSVDNRDTRYYVFEVNYSFNAPYSGYYRVVADDLNNTYKYGYINYYTSNTSASEIVKSGLVFGRIEDRTTNANTSAIVDGSSSLFSNKGNSLWFITHQGFQSYRGFCHCSDYLTVYCSPVEDVTINKTSITINNNTWNGNIYVDNSNNLTYIYPQYTTVNEKNETVTNISNTPIIYNNETKQYYTYDQTTKNYYYITYNATPAPSPSPTPAPTEKPGGSISTPETGKPGGDTGDTTGILAVLVEIRDNMIQGFLDIKAAFVAGFAELSANFTLAIENLNVNIQNVFNKKFPDQSTPETALPSPTPSPSPAPTDPPSPSPAPDPGKPDSGDKTNNFWTIIFPNGGGSEDGKKGIFWALVSLILALIAFFANLAVGVGYLFPFLPDGVVMTINTCLIVIFLFTIIKFIMRSK